MSKISYDFNIIWVQSCSYAKTPLGEGHKHDYFHCMYVTENEGETIIGGNRFSFVPGNLYITPPSITHAFNNFCDTPLKTLEIKFTIDDPSMAEAIAKLPSCIDVTDYPIEKILSDMVREAEKKKSRYKEIMACEFQLFLTYLLRCNELSGKVCEKKNTESTGSMGIDRAIVFINKNLKSDINLLTLAKEANLEKNYFVRKFKEKTGKTPMIYVRDRRIEEAKQLLRLSDMNVTQIAYETGFKTIHYFSKTFFDSTGKRPVDYRKENS